MAHWLFTQKNTVGVFITDAKFIASWKSPSEVAPSPNHARDAMLSPRIFAAHASNPTKDHGGGYATQDSDCALSVARKDPVRLVACVQCAGLRALLAPVEGVGADAALSLKGHRPFVE